MTEFISIYDRFLSKVTDFSMARLDQSLVEEDLRLKLLSALAYFPELPDEKKEVLDTSFVQTLSVEEEEIISLLMVINYFDKYIVNEDNMRIQLNSKDYKQYSQASLLKELKSTKTLYQSICDAKRNAYAMREMIRNSKR